MSKKTYSEKLKDPRWQKRRLDVLSRENFTCETCASDEKTLHVHHCYYEKGMEPWDYPDHALKCLCETCHQDRQAAELSIQRAISRLNFDGVNSLYCDILYAVHFHGIKSVAKFCRSLGT